MDLQHEADRLLEGSMALNTLNSYRTGLASYEKFLSIQGLENKWPPSTDNITHFIAYLSLQGLSFRTAQLYTSAIGYKSFGLSRRNTTICSAQSFGMVD